MNNALPPAPRRGRTHGWPLPRLLGRGLLWIAIAAVGVTGIVLLAGLRSPQRPVSARPSDLGALAGPPARVCGSQAMLGRGPLTAPRSAMVIPAGNNSRVSLGRAHTTYWFAPGIHTLGRGNAANPIHPGAGSTYIGAPGAILDGQETVPYAFGGSAPGVTIEYLTVQDFGTRGGNFNQGVVNHDSASGWTIEHATVRDNAGAGVMLGSYNTLSYDCLEDNQQYGFNAYSPSGPRHLLLDHNEIAGNDTYNWEAHVPGCGCTGGGKFWDVAGAVITDNWVHGNRSVGLWAYTNNRGFEIEGNYFGSNYDSGLIYEISYNALIEGNIFFRNGLGAGPANQGFPTGAIYLSESGADSRVPGPYGSVLSVTGNTFTDNWGGVILWENSNRFCGSPANTSSGDCTLVDPGVVTVRSCDAAHIASAPYFSDCRWKTQNVSVSHNTFDFNPAEIGPSCTIANDCGFQGVFSEYGSYPRWSPYKGIIVENHITFDQHNVFSANVYNGPWRFMVHQQGNVVSWAVWRSRPYHQDAGSTLDGVGAPSPSPKVVPAAGTAPAAAGQS